MFIKCATWVSREKMKIFLHQVYPSNVYLFEVNTIESVCAVVLNIYTPLTYFVQIVHLVD